MEQIIYKLTSPSGRVYIGKTNNFPRRLIEHLYSAKEGNTKLYTSIRKYGWDNFTKEVLYQGTCSNEFLDELERIFIKQYNSLLTGLNGTIGGDGWPAGVKQSPESNAKRSATRKKNGSPGLEAYNRTQKGVPKPYIRAKLGRPVLMYSKDNVFIREWSSIAEAGECMGIDRGDISSACSGRKLSTGGYIWRYKS